MVSRFIYASLVMLVPGLSANAQCCFQPQCCCTSYEVNYCCDESFDWQICPSHECDDCSAEITWRWVWERDRCGRLIRKCVPEERSVAPTSLSEIDVLRAQIEDLERRVTELEQRQGVTGTN